jgi:hypothetical protein
MFLLFAVACAVAALLSSTALTFAAVFTAQTYADVTVGRVTPWDVGRRVNFVRPYERTLLVVSLVTNFMLGCFCSLPPWIRIAVFAFLGMYLVLLFRVFVHYAPVDILTVVQRSAGARKEALVHGSAYMLLLLLSLGLFTWTLGDNAH